MTELHIHTDDSAGYTHTRIIPMKFDIYELALIAHRLNNGENLSRAHMCSFSHNDEIFSRGLQKRRYVKLMEKFLDEGMAKRKGRGYVLTKNGNRAVQACLKHYAKIQQRPYKKSNTGTG